jgi:hypothetical protein
MDIFGITRRSEICCLGSAYPCGVSMRMIKQREIAELDKACDLG